MEALSTSMSVSSFRVALGSAFTYGVLTFFSPCILPMVPGYISFLTAEGGEASGSRFKVFFSSLLFVLTFTAIFSLIGFGAGSIGAFVTTNSTYLRFVGGTLIVFFGLQMSGLLLKEWVPRVMVSVALLLLSLYMFGILGKYILPTVGMLLLLLSLYYAGLHKMMYGEARLKVTPKGVLKPVLLGIAFSIGWSPCLGPFLGAVIVQSMAFPPLQSAVMLSVYSLGLALPFLILGSASSLLFSIVSKISRYGWIMELVGGAFLVLTGLVIFYGLV